MTDTGSTGSGAGTTGTSEALEHLQHAVEMSEEFRQSARDDSDLDPIRDEPAFRRLITVEKPAT